MNRGPKGPAVHQVVVALDKFKGTMTSLEAARALARGLGSVAPDVRVVIIPMADGGEGTLELLRSQDFEIVPIEVVSADGSPVTSGLAWNGRTAVVESASICGPPASGRTDALGATSYGVGEAVASALELGAAEIVVALGGSSTTDGGAGFLSALGVRCLDAKGSQIPRGGGGLNELARLDWSHLDPRLGDVDLRVACDVESPLYGPHGAAAVFGPQKGADPADVAVLDAGLRNLAAIVQSSAVRGVDAARLPALAEARGAGAAGGLGYANLLVGATYVSGAEFALAITDAASAIRDSTIVITGEGSLDHQSVRGKAPSVVAEVCADQGVPAIAVVGRTLLTEPELRSAGFEAAFALVDRRTGCATSHERSIEAITAVGVEIGQVLGEHDPDATWNHDQRLLADCLDRRATVQEQACAGAGSSPRDGKHT